MVNVRSYVRITEDKTEAWLYLCAPDDGTKYEKSEIMRYLQLKGVVAGINESHIAAMCNKQIYEREVKVASSVKGDPGREGWFEFFFNTEKPKPKINKDGTVDYRSMSLVQNVSEGDKLAVYHPAVQGTSGRDVTGAFEKANMYKELRPLTGKGIANTENPNEYYATKSGKIEYDGENKLSVVEVYEVQGGCDYANNALVEFNGDVIIHGNVEAGVTVHAGKSLTVEGVVESAMISAGGDVCLKRGMQGSGKGTISAGGNVFTEFLEYANIKAAGSIQSNVILNSRVESEDTVTLTGKKGLIAGGNVHAMMGITCQNVGNASEIKTGIHVGVLPELMEKRMEVSQEYGKLNAQLDEIVVSMARILRVRQQTGELSDQLKAHLEDLKEKKDEVYRKCMQLKKEADKLETQVMQAREAKIRISGNIYKGTIIAIDDHQMPIQKDTSFMEYSSQNGMIVGTVIVV
ncbi:MAG: FapA family protein [Lachnospiraceae bacterium]|nr:FapA family protein [Lachnospiraceae bacterium]